MTYRTSSDSLEITERLAAKLGARLRGGEVIALSSDLGGGKTAFVRGLAKGMGSIDHVASPTFTIGRQYISKTHDLTLFHFDFYRLQEPGIMSLELSEVLEDPRAVIAIEWGGIVENVLPEFTVHATIIRTAETARDFMFEYPSSLDYLFKEDISSLQDIEAIAGESR